MPDVFLLWAKAEAIPQPGQFFMLRCGGDTILRRPLSVHKQEGGRLAFLFKVVGKGTLWLSQRKEGQALDLIGPLGKGFNLFPHNKNLLLIAGGLGIAPLVFLAERAIKAGHNLTLLLGAKTKAHLYPHHLLPQGIKVFIATEDGSQGQKGLVTDLLALPLNFDQAFASGPLSMYQTLSSLPLLQRKEVQVTLEVRLGCGFGACLGCSIPTKEGQKLVCRDGPVFHLRETIWEGVKLW